MAARRVIGKVAMAPFNAVHKVLTKPYLYFGANVIGLGTLTYTWHQAANLDKDKDELDKFKARTEALIRVVRLAGTVACVALDYKEQAETNTLCVHLGVLGPGVACILGGLFSVMRASAIVRNVRVDASGGALGHTQTTFCLLI